MERLTGRDVSGKAVPNKAICGTADFEILERLAAYEDTGLLPEEVVKMGMMLEDSRRYSGRLELKLKPYLDIGLGPSELNALKLASMGKCVVEIKEFDGIAIDRLRELALAEKGGLIPPCKRGDVVYCIRRNPRTGYFVKALTVCTVTVWGAGRFSIFTTKEDILGKTVFLTREEAEAALKGGGE